MASRLAAHTMPPSPNASTPSACWKSRAPLEPGNNLHGRATSFSTKTTREQERLRAAKSGRLDLRDTQMASPDRELQLTILNCTSPPRHRDPANPCPRGAPPPRIRLRSEETRRRLRRLECCVRGNCFGCGVEHALRLDGDLRAIFRREFPHNITHVNLNGAFTHV
jgi:hypothetical protein